jgi:hypothetical protein
MIRQSLLTRNPLADITMQNPVTLILTFSLTVGVAFAQTSPPTGVQKAGLITLLRTETKTTTGAVPVESTTEVGLAVFASTDYMNYTPPTPTPQTTIGPCVWAPIPAAPPATPGTHPVITPLDAGPVINLNGPNGAKQLKKMGGDYSAMLGGGAALPIPGLPSAPPYLDPGAYTIDNGAGGADVGSFTVTLNVPSPGLVWTNADANLTIVRSAGVDVQWTGGDPTTNVTIQGSVVGLDPTQQVPGGSFTCTVPNTGEFFVTSDVLSLLPATPATGSLIISGMSVSTLSQATFSASGIDGGGVGYVQGDSRNVVFQ